LKFEVELYFGGGDDNSSLKQCHTSSLSHIRQNYTIWSLYITQLF